MVLPESKTFSFGISDSPNISKAALFLYFNYFCQSVSFQTWFSPLRFNKRNTNYIEMTSKVLWNLKFHDVIRCLNMNQEKPFSE